MPYILPFDDYNVEIAETYAGPNEYKNGALFYAKPGTQVRAVEHGQIFGAAIGIVPQNQNTLEARLAAAHTTNYIIIRHLDGTFTQYLHIIPLILDGYLSQGTIIGLTGEHDKLYRPHLHFLRFKLESKNIIYLPVEFENNR
ncbi:MAG: M23 family metallopeptidase [Nanoarchaeota archaeon]